MGRIIFFAFLFLVIGGMTATVVWRERMGEGVESARAFRPAPVTAMVVEAREFADVVEALGDARANESVAITSLSTDIITRVAFDSGDVVSTGQVLAELASAAEDADLMEARATQEETRTELARVEALVARGASTRSLVDQARAAMERAEARVAALEAERSDLIIRAPFDGVIGLRNASPGMLVQPGDTIATLDDISVIKVDFTLPERFLTQAEPGAPLSVRAAAYEGVIFDGVIAQVDTRVDPVTRSAVVRAEIDNADGRLRPGMLMLVEMQRNTRMNPAAPEVSLVRRGADAFVYVVTDATDGVASVEMRPVTAGMRRDGVVEIVSGLTAGETIVADGVHRVRPNAPVRVVGDAGSRDDRDEPVAAVKEPKA